MLCYCIIFYIVQSFVESLSIFCFYFEIRYVEIDNWNWIVEFHSIVEICDDYLFNTYLIVIFFTFYTIILLIYVYLIIYVINLFDQYINLYYEFL